MLLGDISLKKDVKRVNAEPEAQGKGGPVQGFVLAWPGGTFGAAGAAGGSGVVVVCAGRAGAGLESAGGV
jgi:hypothetical protein